MWHPALKNAAQTIKTYGMFHIDDSVLVGLSGGPDSVALLHILLELAPRYSFNIAVAHLNHSLRGASSDTEAEYVKRLAKRLNLPYYIRKKDVRAYQHAHRLSLEEAARNVRYAFFQEIAEKNRCNVIALGHHADDNAELVLMYLLRGTGTAGISGIPPRRNFHGMQIVRPLIHLTRDEILDFLTKKKLSYVLDESNTDTTYLRNRIRHDLLPILRREYQPRVTEVLNRFSAIVRSESEWIDQEVIPPLFKAVVISADEKRIVFSRQKLAELHPAAKQRLFRKAIKWLKGDLRRIAFTHTQAIIQLLQSKSQRGRLDLPSRICVKSDSETLTIQRQKVEGRGQKAIQFQYCITELGTFFIREAGIYMTFEKVSPEYDPVRCMPNSDRSYELFDMDMLRFPLTVRNINPGDRFTPLGMTGTQKLKTYFINNKIPLSERTRYPVLVSGEKIIWVVGHRIADSVKLTPSTRNILKVGMGMECPLPNEEEVSVEPVLQKFGVMVGHHADDDHVV